MRRPNQNMNPGRPGRPGPRGPGPKKPMPPKARSTEQKQELAAKDLANVAKQSFKKMPAKLTQQYGISLVAATIGFHKSDVISLLNKGNHQFTIDSPTGEVAKATYKSLRNPKFKNELASLIANKFGETALETGLPAQAKAEVRGMRTYLGVSKKVPDVKIAFKGKKKNRKKLNADYYNVLPAIVAPIIGAVSSLLGGIMGKTAPSTQAEDVAQTQLVQQSIIYRQQLLVAEQAESTKKYVIYGLLTLGVISISLIFILRGTSK